MNSESCETTSEEILIPGKGDFVCAAFTGAALESFGADRLALKQSDFYMSRSVDFLEAGVMAGLSWRAGTLFKKKILREYNALRDGGREPLAAALGAAASVRAAGYRNSFEKRYGTALSHTDNQTLAAIRAAISPPNLKHDWIMETIATLESEVPCGVSNRVARNLLASRLPSNMKPPLEGMVKMLEFFKQELDIDEASAALLVIMPISGEYKVGRTISPGGRLNLINRRAVDEFRKIRPRVNF